MNRNIFAFALMLPIVGLSQNNQKSNQQNDVTAPLYLIQPGYESPYNISTAEVITKVIDKVYNYLEAVTPPQVVDASGTEISDFAKINAQTNAQFSLARRPFYERASTCANGKIYGTNQILRRCHKTGTAILRSYV